MPHTHTHTPHRQHHPLSPTPIPIERWLGTCALAGTVAWCLGLPHPSSPSSTPSTSKKRPCQPPPFINPPSLTFLAPVLLF
ncbi:hypothetical protein EJ06DRAFT_531042 [Trichodelitschia bisporula]|uniref:Uncharacterized protein n=1 Tax=Trichodelitschia bisporula TaxID=703511 RepID=A0A6G1HUK7_9PEZI|nr:hypothetical protein EJ06DRAFT_531042 [Trichodelitschia bisporula]